MINKICANIDKNHIWHCDTKPIGRQGENICTQLEITLEECLCDSWVYLHFEKANGKTKVTERLEIIDNKVTYDIGNDLLDIDGDLKVFVELHKESGLVWRSSTKTYTVLNSFNGLDQIENKDDFITETQKKLDLIKTDGIGDKYLSNDGTYKEVQGGSGIGKKYIVDGVEKGEIFNDYENNIASNLYSHAEGKGTEAKGENSHAQNRRAKAYGKHSHAQNYDTLAQGESSTAMGVQTKAFQKGSVAEGNMSEAGLEKIMVDGVETLATSIFNPAHAEGEQTKAIGYASHSEGKRTDAIGDYSHTEGEFTQALKEASHAEGRNVIADNMYAHGEGLDNKALGLASHVEGQYSKAQGEASHAEGSSTIAKQDFTHAEGIGSKVYDKASHAEGAGTIAGRKPTNSGGGTGDGGSDEGDEGGNIPEGIEGIWASHAEGIETKAIGQASHSEGIKTEAFSNSSHAEGVNTLAYGEASHTEGGWTQTGEFDTNGEHRGTTGNYAHAEGFDTRAVGQYSHTEGKGTVAKGEAQHVQGKYNLLDSNNTYAHIVGCGTSDSDRKNAYTLDWSGNAVYRGSIFINTSKKVATEEYVVKKIGDIESILNEVV